jgi:hypothetical protein
MLSKIIFLPAKKRQQKLSKLMVVALVDACVKQKHGIPFGPMDIKGGSIGSLITRGLIVHENVVEKNTQSFWHVTNEAIEILKSMGIDAID